MILLIYWTTPEGSLSEAHDISANIGLPNVTYAAE